MKTEHHRGGKASGVIFQPFRATHARECPIALQVVGLRLPFDLVERTAPPKLRWRTVAELYKHNIFDTHPTEATGTPRA